MINEKQTAVEMLLEQITKYTWYDEEGFGHVSVSILDLKQVKEIEQQQIENSFDAGVSSVTKNFDKAYSEIDGEEYYKQNFEQQEKCINYEKDS